MKNYIFIFLAFLLVFTGCCCKDSTKSGDTGKVKVADPALAPGHALVEAEILSVDENTCTFKIISIQNRGQGTNLLTKGQEHNVKLNDALKKSEVKTGEKYKLKIRGMHEPAEMGGNEKTKWQVVSVTK